MKTILLQNRRAAVQLDYFQFAPLAADLRRAERAPPVCRQAQEVEPGRRDRVRAAWRHDPAGVAGIVERAGLRVELVEPSRIGGGWNLDVILSERTGRLSKS